MISGDIQPPTAAEPAEPPAFLFVPTNVTSWADLSALFKKAKEQHGRIDYVFANAGIGPRANYLAIETDDNGDLKEPTCEVLDVNLKSVINTACLAVHFMKQQPEGGSIVLMGSSTGLQPLRAPDYCRSKIKYCVVDWSTSSLQTRVATAKHGVLGFGRGYARLVEAADLPIRINTLMPSWTTTSILPDMGGIMKGVSHEAQPGLAVARAAAYLMVDASRQGNVIYVSDGKYKEIEKAVLWPAYESIKGEGNPSDDEIMKRIVELSGQ